jgi:hypothetical protein
VNGPDLDKGPSDLSLDHTFQLNGLLDLPWQVQLSGIFRAQSGFHFSRNNSTTDPDGDGTLNGIDVVAGRNAFTAPAYVNLDMRFAKRFNIGERFKAQVLFEFFNIFNRQNPAAVENRTTNPAVRSELKTKIAGPRRTDRVQTRFFEWRVGHPPPDFGNSLCALLSVSLGLR